MREGDKNFNFIFFYFLSIVEREILYPNTPPLLRRFGVVPPVAIHFTSSNESPDVTRLKLWLKKLKFLPQRLQGSLL